jgi:hypothetical protein
LRPPSWEGIPSEHLTPIEQLCHVRDIEIEGYQKRFHRTLTESNPQLESLDTDGLAQTRSYATADDREVLAAFRAARAQTLDLVHYLCSHDQQHLAGLQWLLGQIDAVDPAHREP